MINNRYKNVYFFLHGISEQVYVLFFRIQPTFVILHPPTARNTYLSIGIYGVEEYSVNNNNWNRLNFHFTNDRLYYIAQILTISF